MKNLSKAKLICFTGMDGAGKTTLAKFLVEEMKKHGLKCNYVYGRYKPILSRPVLILGKFLFLRGRDIKEYNIYSSAKRDAVKRYQLVAFLYQKFLLFDYSLQLLTKIIFPKTHGRTVICDRYIYDTVINDIPRADDDFNHLKRLIEKCFRIAPEPDLIFLIDLAEETAYSRKDDTPSIGYLKERRNIYLDIGVEYDMWILDGNKDLTALKEQVQEEVFKYMKRGDFNLIHYQ
jgi:thymidylate kinase